MDLTQLEQQAMLAIQRQHPDAYGVSVQQEILKQTGKEYPFASIYASLDRLEKKGFVASRQGEATAQRGGRRKLHYQLTAAGVRTLRASLDALTNLRRGIRWAEVADAEA